LNNRLFNIFSILLILIWIWADRNWQIGAPAYGWLLLIYVSVLFCGSYFIRWGFFLKSICSANTKEKWIALSFDDGPSASTTGRILDILKENQTEAVFFCIGKNISGNEDLLKRIPAEGHMIGNHSFSHNKLFDLFSAGRMSKDLQEMNLICKENTGLLPRFFRPPYGVTNPNLKKAVLMNGFISIGWSIRSFDTLIKNQDKLLNRIEKRLKPGAILLLHDGCEITVAVLPRLLQRIRSKGYQVQRLDKMLNLNPYD
jgi:peptidoglycan-N-acetylglucosamine deacetylase